MSLRMMLLILNFQTKICSDDPLNEFFFKFALWRLEWPFYYLLRIFKWNFLHESIKNPFNFGIFQLERCFSKQWSIQSFEPFIFKPETSFWNHVLCLSSSIIQILI